MKNMKKIAALMMAMMLALGLGAFAMAETTETANTAAADALKEAEEKSQALNDALTAYNSAKTESRKQARIASLKEELDAYVAAGSLTQEQADLLLSYYAEQIAQNQGMGRGGKGMRNGQNGQMNGFGKGMRNGFGKGGRSVQPGQQAPAAPQSNDSTAAVGTGI